MPWIQLLVAAAFGLVLVVATGIEALANSPLWGAVLFGLLLFLLISLYFGIAERVLLAYFLAVTISICLDVAVRGFGLQLWFGQTQIKQVPIVQTSLSIGALFASLITVAALVRYRANPALWAQLPSREAPMDKWLDLMRGPKIDVRCTKCGNALEYMGSLFEDNLRNVHPVTVLSLSRDNPAASLLSAFQKNEQWHGNVCPGCASIWCPACCDLGPTPCPKCGAGKLPAFREHIESIRHACQ